MQRLLSLIGEIVGVITRFAVFLAIVVIGGFASAWVMVHSGSALSTAMAGPWVTWPQSGRVDADPYTRAHTVRLGLLPLNSSLAITYHARNDSEGQRIHSSCDYLVEVDGLDAAWWSIAVFNDAGFVVANTAQRYAFNSSTVVRDTDGGASIVLARDARPGNWLPTRGIGNLTLALTVQDPKWTQQSIDTSNTKPKVLPQISKSGCPG
jgi:hypothetical protein